MCCNNRVPVSEHEKQPLHVNTASVMSRGFIVWSTLCLPCCCGVLLSPPGVGISGLEGMQAAMASDFTIAQFRFLAPLLLVHGRLSYKRITRMICFFFYKNLLYGSTIFVYNAFSLFSGQPIYNDFYMTLFNVVFTAAAPLVVGWFDRDLDKNMGLKYPFLYKEGGCRFCMPAVPVQRPVALADCRQAAITVSMSVAFVGAQLCLLPTFRSTDLVRGRRPPVGSPAVGLTAACCAYVDSAIPGCASLLLTGCIIPNVAACCLCCSLSGQRNLYFSLPAIVGWLGTAFLHAALIVIMVLLGADSLDSDSRSGHAWSLLRNGLLMFTIVIITVHLQLAMVIDQWTWIHHIAIWGSIGERL